MAAQLWFLRHGEAEPHDARPDAERRLTERGEGQARSAGRAFVRLGLEFHRVLTSPYVRALDTARIACENLGCEPEILDALAGDFDAAQARKLVEEADTDQRILLVGHEPDFSHTVRQLTGGHIDLKKGGVVAVRMSGEPAELIALMRPRELDRLAGRDGPGSAQASVAEPVESRS